jgi:hypothetical protein
LHKEQQVGLSQSTNIEKDLINFAKSIKNHKKLDLPKIAASIEKRARRTGVEYAFAEMAKADIERLTVYRFKVSFKEISLVGLINFLIK